MTEIAMLCSIVVRKNEIYDVKLKFNAYLQRKITPFFFVTFPKHFNWHTGWYPKLVLKIVEFQQKRFLFFILFTCIPRYCMKVSPSRTWDK